MKKNKVEEKICKTCKWWQVRVLVGCYFGFEFGDCAIAWDEDREENDTIYVSDCYMYGTKSNFGCKHWKEKK